MSVSAVIDAHQHVWDLSRADYPWLDSGLAPIDRTVDFGEIWPTMQELGVTGTVLVQAADNAEDTANMQRVADRYPRVVGIVGWVPLDEPVLTERTLAELTTDARIVGIRTLLHANPDPAWVLRSDVLAGIGMVAAAGLTFDFVTGGPAALTQIPAVSAAHPDLKIVIDHLGKPPVGGSAADRVHWRELIAIAAENPLVSAKLSGLYASAGALDGWSLDDIRPFVDDALDVFGPDRLMYGGDWPISVLAGGYRRTFTALTDALDDLDQAARSAIWGGTATSVYGLKLS